MVHSIQIPQRHGAERGRLAVQPQPQHPQAGRPPRLLRRTDSKPSGHRRGLHKLQQEDIGGSRS